MLSINYSDFVSSDLRVRKTICFTLLKQLLNHEAMMNHSLPPDKGTLRGYLPVIYRSQIGDDLRKVKAGYVFKV